MFRESGPNNSGESEEQSVLELVANYFEREAIGWLSEPEKYHPLSGAIEKGWYGTKEERRDAVNEDASEVSDLLMKIAAEVRNGNLERAKKLLQMSALRSDEAFRLLKAIDPEAKPWFPNADANGDPVVIGRRYRWDPGKDNRGNKPGYYLEGVVTKESGGMAEAVWEKVGEKNPAYWKKDDADRENQEEAVQETRPTRVFTTMLTPTD